VGAVLGLVLGDFDFVEADVAVLADLAEFHDEFVADVGVRGRFDAWTSPETARRGRRRRRTP